MARYIVLILHKIWSHQMMSCINCWHSLCNHVISSKEHSNLCHGPPGMLIGGPCYWGYCIMYSVTGCLVQSWEVEWPNPEGVKQCMLCVVCYHKVIFSIYFMYIYIRCKRMLHVFITASIDIVFVGSYRNDWIIILKLCFQINFCHKIIYFPFLWNFILL